MIFAPGVVGPYIYTRLCDAARRGVCSKLCLTGLVTNTATPKQTINSEHSNTVKYFTQKSKTDLKKCNRCAGIFPAALTEKW